MSTAASAVTTVESATTRQNERVEFNGWDDSGTPIRVEPAKASPSKADSATATKEKKDAVADSAPPKDKKDAVNASDSATDNDTQKPHRKPEDYGEKRFQELANENKTLKQRLDALERGKTSDEKRETQQVSQPAKEAAKVPGLKPFLEQFFAKAENKGKAYEDGVEAWQDARQVERDKQTEQRIRQQVQQESASKEFSAKMKDAETRYGKEEAAKIIPAVDKIVADTQIPAVIKAMLDRSDVLIDLTYALSSDPAEFDNFVKLCKSDAAAALEKLVTVQALVRETLKGKSGADKSQKTGEQEDADKPGKTTPERGADGKFLSSEGKDGKEQDGASDQDKPRVPKPHSEVGGRGTASVSEEAAAAASNDFKAMDAAMTRRFAAQLRK
jgi:hypothetical protein